MCYFIFHYEQVLRFCPIPVKNTYPCISQTRGLYISSQLSYLQLGSWRQVGHSPVLEVGVDHAVGEALAADADALQHTVAGELVHHQVGVDHTWPGAEPGVRQGNDGLSRIKKANGNCKLVLKVTL